MKICITTLGCPKNTVDSAHLEEALLSEGFESLEDPAAADIILLNTCGFIRDAKEESVEEILRLAEAKKVPGSGFRDREKEGETAHDGAAEGMKKLIVFGCLAQRYRNELLREMPEIDALWGVGEEDKIVAHLKALRDGHESTTQGSGLGVLDSGFGGQSPAARESGLLTHGRGKRAEHLRPLNASYAYLKVAEGCNKRCTFCVIPSIRGPFRSAGPEKLLREAEQHVRRGARELILVAQDITDYGRDLKGYGLVSLLSDLSSIEGDFRIRLLYLYPTTVTDELLSLIASEEKVLKYLDIPIQHSEDRLLRLMGRRGTRKEYLRLVRRARRAIPGVTLRTTFIVGFPSETEEDFNGLVDFIEEVRFERLGAFTYSREEGTAAALLKGQVSGKVKQRRLDELMRRQALISLEKNRELIGRRFEALIEEVDGTLAIARIGSQAPEIDGVTIIEESRVESEQLRVMSDESTTDSQDTEDSVQGSGGISEVSGKKGDTDSVRYPASPVAAGDLVTVEIVDAYDYDLKAKLVAADPSSPAER